MSNSSSKSVQIEYSELSDEEKQDYIETNLTVDDKENFLELQKSSTKISMIYIINTYGSLNITKLSKILGKSKGTISPQLIQLHQEGYVEIDNSPGKWGKYYQLTNKTKALIDMLRQEFDMEEAQKELESYKGLSRKEFINKVMHKLYTKKRKLAVNVSQYIESSLELTYALKKLSITETEVMIKNGAVLAMMKYIIEHDLENSDLKMRILEFENYSESNNLTDELNSIDLDNKKEVLQFILDQYLSKQYKPLGEKLIEEKSIDPSEYLIFPLGEFNDLLFSLKIASVEQLTQFEEISLEYVDKLEKLRDKFEKENKGKSKKEINLQLVNIFMGPIQYQP